MSLPRNIRRDDPARAEPHPGRLALCRVGLLWLHGPDFQTHAFELRRQDLFERGRDGLSCFLRFAATLILRERQEISALRFGPKEGR